MSGVELAEGKDFWFEFKQEIRKIRGSRNHGWDSAFIFNLYAWLMSSWVPDIGVYAYISNAHRDNFIFF